MTDRAAPEGNEDTRGRGVADAPPRMPPWVKVFGTILAAVIVAFLIALIVKGPDHPGQGHGMGNAWLPAGVADGHPASGGRSL